MGGGDGGADTKRLAGHLMTNHPPFGMVDVFSATIPTLKFSPGVHVFYAETVLPIRDGSPEVQRLPDATLTIKRTLLLTWT